MTKKLTFKHILVPQRSPEWIAARIGKVTASRLGDFTNYLKNGNDSAARRAYLRELAYERTFGAQFDHYVTPAMQAGIDNEGYVREQYEKHTGNKVVTCGIFANETFAASPDGLVGEDGLIEIKWVQSPKFAEILETGRPPKEHWLQMQGQMLATSRKWCDYVVANGQSGKFVIIRVERDLDCSNLIVKSIDAYVNDPEQYIEFDTVVEPIDFNGEPPEPTPKEEDIWS